MRSVCLLHAPADRSAAEELRRFIETGCDVGCFCAEAVDLVQAAASAGFSADVLVILLSKALAPWPERRVWEPVLVGEALSNGVAVLGLELESCEYPRVLKPVFRSRRMLKRWLWSGQVAAGESADLEPVYRAVSDAPGQLEVPVAVARRFVSEAEFEFGSTAWVPCPGRTSTQQLGALGLALGVDLRGEPAGIRRLIAEKLEHTRSLVVFEGLTGDVPVVVRGRSSVLTTPDADSAPVVPDSFAGGRELVMAGRFAEAFEMFERLPQTAACRSEMAWILHAWGRTAEANEVHPGGHLFAEQPTLFGGS